MVRLFTKTGRDAKQVAKEVNIYNCKMADEYYWSTFYNNDDLVGRVLWYDNDRGHYGYAYPYEFDRGNVTKSDDEPPDTAVYVRAVLGFMVRSFNTIKMIV